MAAKFSCKFLLRYLIVTVAFACGTAALGTATVAYAATVELTKASIADLQAAMEKGTLTSEALVKLYLARIEAYDEKGPKINAVLALSPNALETARALDAERKQKGPRSPLHGIPVIVKDVFDTYDMPTTGGYAPLKGVIPAKDATMVKRLRDAGGRPVGHARPRSSDTRRAPATIASSFANARSRGRYFMPQSGPTTSRSGRSTVSAARIRSATVSALSTSSEPRSRTPSTIVLSHERPSAAQRSR